MKTRTGLFTLQRCRQEQISQPRALSSNLLTCNHNVMIHRNIQRACFFSECKWIGVVRALFIFVFIFEWPDRAFSQYIWREVLVRLWGKGGGSVPPSESEVKNPFPTNFDEGKGFLSFIFIYLFIFTTTYTSFFLQRWYSWIR